MKNKDPVFWAARRVHRMLSQSSERSDDLSSRAGDVTADLAAMQRLRRMLSTAESKRWRAAAMIVRERLLAQAARVQSGCCDLSRERQRPALPALSELLADLRQLHEQFERVDVQPRHGRICVVTDAITLEGVPLGTFSIELCLGRLVNHQDVSAFGVIAQDPNPPSGSGDTVHPHVSDKSLCAGEATVPIASALAEGRICDAFCLVNAVLHTYNPASAYVSLSDWEGVLCGDCGHRCHPDEVYYCDGCGREYCESCISSCERCDRSICLTCLNDNGDDDGELVCHRCQRLCRRCGGSGDPARLRRQGGLCDGCHAEEEETDDAQPTDEGVLVGATEVLPVKEQSDEQHQEQRSEPAGGTVARADPARGETEVNVGGACGTRGG